MPAHIAALDIGSNTIHLTVARISKDATDVVRLADETDLVRLGADVHATGTISAERMGRACATIRRQVALAHASGASVVLGIATEGLRAAKNGGELIERIRQEADIDIQLISGEQEAALTYWGATSGLRPRKGNLAVVDMGGGSLELAVGKGQAIVWRASLPLGSGTIVHQHALSDPPTPEEVLRVEHVVTSELARVNPPLPVAEAIVCGGTASTLAALGHRPLGGYPPQSVVPRFRQLNRQQLETLLVVLEGLSATEIGRRFDVDDGRARLLPAGGAVLIGTMDLLGVNTLRVRRRGLREGAILTYARVGERWLDAAASGMLTRGSASQV